MLMDAHFVLNWKNAPLFIHPFILLENNAYFSLCSFDHYTNCMVQAVNKLYEIFWYPGNQSWYFKCQALVLTTCEFRWLTGETGEFMNAMDIWDGCLWVVKDGCQSVVMSLSWYRMLCMPPKFFWFWSWMYLVFLPSPEPAFHNTLSSWEDGLCHLHSDSLVTNELFTIKT